MIYTCNPSKIVLFDNRSLKINAGKIKAKLGCDIVLNGSLFNWSDYNPCCDIRIGGKTINDDQWGYFGYGWNNNELPRVMHSRDMFSVDNYLSCIWAIHEGEKQALNDNQAGIGGTRGRTAFGFKKDGSMVIICTSDFNGAMKLSATRDALYNQGCVNGIILDGGGSSQIDTPTTDIISNRIVSNYVCVWINKENTSTSEGENTTSTTVITNNEKNADELVEYAKAQLGKPYWMGTFGQIASSSIYTYNKSRLPQYYTATDFPSQYGKRVHDCIGLIKGYLWSDTPTSVPTYKGSQDYSADSMYTACKTKGLIATIPDVAGILVFMTGHVGIYIGNGYVIEARGHAYGVVQTKLSERPWVKWGYCPLINYENVVTIPTTSTTIPSTPTIPTVPNTIIYSNYIKKFQTWLNTGYRMGLIVNGVYDTATKKCAVKAYQTYLNMTYKSGLVVDGVWGAKTNSATKSVVKGIKGNQVYILQGLLYCNGYDPNGFDGYFGNGMYATLKTYQTDKGLEIDGIAGRGTFEDLMK